MHSYLSLLLLLTYCLASPEDLIDNCKLNFQETSYDLTPLSLPNP